PTRARVRLTPRHRLVRHPREGVRCDRTRQHGDPPMTDAPDEDLIQLLGPDGRRNHEAVYAPRVAHLDREALEGLYRDMALVRRFDTEATALQRHGELGLWAPCLEIGRASCRGRV